MPMDMNFKDVNWKNAIIGDYDWGFLCMPRVPWGKSKQPPPFFKKDESISLLVTMTMGLQHCLAMVGGIVTVPLVLSSAGVANFTSAERQYLISAGLIVSGFATLVQVIQIRVPNTRFAIGSGLLSVMGISFTFLPISESVIPVMMDCKCNDVPCHVGDPDCLPCQDNGTLIGSCLTGQQAYGKILGTVMVCCWINVLISFVPVKILKRLFPPVVTGTTVMLIGFALCKVGIEAWGGGNFCASQVLTTQIPCYGNGEVVLPFGSPQYVGLGFVVFFTLVIVELFGSPFLRNVQVAIGLLVGMIVASSVSYNSCEPIPPTCTENCFGVLPPGVAWDPTTKMTIGAVNSSIPSFPNSTVCTTSCVPNAGTTCTTQRFVTGQAIAEAEWITFLWVHWFPLGFYPPVVLPVLFGFIVSSMECIGDVTATTEASGLVPVGDDYTTAVSGGILADGLNSFLGAIGTSLPVVTFAANNGIISLTRCAARRAGIACACYLILFGIIQKFAAIILTIPDCVLGGMNAFLFINVAVSGMRVITMEGGINRRSRFIAAMSMTLGIGVELVPYWFNIAGQPGIYPFQGNFWPIDPTWSEGMAGFRDAIIIVLTNGFTIGGFTALLLNLVMPHDADDVDELGEEDSHEATKMEALKEEYPHPHLPPEEQRDPLHPHAAPPAVEMQSASQTEQPASQPV